MLADLIRAELDRQEVMDATLRAGIAATIVAEGPRLSWVEPSYADVSNPRLRQIFGNRLRQLSDSDLRRAKEDDVVFFDLVYGGAGADLGNTAPGDGYRFRGRGVAPLRGRRAYERIGQLIGVALTDADAAISTETSVAIAVAIGRLQGYGAPWRSLRRMMGSQSSDVLERRDALFSRYAASDAFAPPGYVPPPIEDARVTALSAMLPPNMRTLTSAPARSVLGAAPISLTAHITAINARLERIEAMLAERSRKEDPLTNG